MTRRLASSADWRSESTTSDRGGGGGGGAGGSVALGLGTRAARFAGRRYQLAGGAGDLGGQRARMGGPLVGDHGQGGGDLWWIADRPGGGRGQRTVMAGLLQRRQQLFDGWRLGRGLAAGGNDHPECSESGTAGEHTPPVEDGYCSGHSNILPLRSSGARSGTISFRA
ncbi:hypothetical protein MMEU_0043 [Mycobacterium marinum str. Europe]|nr:hypothetical protein MMEU_0043 [Mycobacterium marinum str. Europe]